MHLLSTTGFEPNEGVYLPPVGIVDGYVLLAQWAWIAEKQKTTCPAKYPLFGALTTPTVYDEKSELRKLLSTLGDLEASDDTIKCGDVSAGAEAPCRRLRQGQNTVDVP